MLVMVVFIHPSLLRRKETCCCFMPLAEEVEDGLVGDRGKGVERSMVGEPFYRMLVVRLVGLWLLFWLVGSTGSL